MPKQKTKHSTHFSTDAIGWVGVVILIVTGILFDANILDPRHYNLYILNLIGAVCIIIYAAARSSRQAVLLSVFSSLTALTNIIKLITMMR